MLLPARLDPRVAVLRRGDLIGHPRGFRRHVAELAPHESLDREHRVLRVGDRLPLGDLADEPLAFLGERDDRRGEARAFLIDDDRRLPAFHDGNGRVRRAEVDPDDFVGHCEVPRSKLKPSYRSYECMSSILYARITLIFRDELSSCACATYAQPNLQCRASCAIMRYANAGARHRPALRGPRRFR